MLTFNLSRSTTYPCTEKRLWQSLRLASYFYFNFTVNAESRLTHLEIHKKEELAAFSYRFNTLRHYINRCSFRDVQPTVTYNVTACRQKRCSFAPILILPLLLESHKCAETEEKISTGRNAQLNEFIIVFYGVVVRAGYVAGVCR